MTPRRGMPAAVHSSAAALIWVLLAVGTGSSGQTPGQPGDVPMRVLSSAPQYVSGGDVRIEVRAASVEQPRIELLLNGRIVAPKITADGDRLESVVQGLVDGENTLELRHRERGTLQILKLINHPITGPMFAGPKQEPFVCTVNTELGIEPLLDVDDPRYFAVRDAAGKTIGHSRNCSAPSSTRYYYMPTTGKTAKDYKPMPADGSRPADLASTALIDGREVDFIVRYERGTINRFIYQYVMLSPPGEDPARPDTSSWNGRLIYHFQGGVGFGHHQGHIDIQAGDARAIGKGYAVANSSGNRTSTHYDMVLGAETAMMTKEGFIKRYGVPLYTVGLGGSGGAIQQYLYAQNQPGLLDASIAQLSYPDMVGQIIHVADCDLLEYYMDVTDRKNRKWAVTKNRSWLVGMNAEDVQANPLLIFKSSLASLGMQVNAAPGMTECRRSWSGLRAGAMNPTFDSGNLKSKAAGRLDFALWPGLKFSHFGDVRNVYGVDALGYPRSTWDNVGVQYGLQALRNGKISVEEFLDLNLKIGGWKEPSQTVAEGFPYKGIGPAEQSKVREDVDYFDPWGARNMNRWDPAAPDKPASRTTGDLDAMHAMYRAGLVYRGESAIPTIDWRPYLERRLNMHNAHQSFAARKRILQAMGNAEHHVIWMTQTRASGPDFDQTPMALEVMDEWMSNQRAHAERGASANRPPRALDSCFDADGALMHAGSAVWDGVIDKNKPLGACAAAFPMYATSRIVAGGPLEGGIFKCELKSVDTALGDGSYGAVLFNDAQQARLKAIFSAGVCDYTKPDQGRPTLSH